MGLFSIFNSLSHSRGNEDAVKPGFVDKRIRQAKERNREQYSGDTLIGTDKYSGSKRDGGGAGFLSRLFSSRHTSGINTQKSSSNFASAALAIGKPHLVSSSSNIEPEHEFKPHHKDSRSRSQSRSHTHSSKAKHKHGRSASTTQTQIDLDGVRAADARQKQERILEGNRMRKLRRASKSPDLSVVQSEDEDGDDSMDNENEGDESAERPRQAFEVEEIVVIDASSSSEWEDIEDSDPSSLSSSEMDDIYMNEPDPIPTPREQKRLSKFRFGLGLMNRNRINPSEQVRDVAPVSRNKNSRSIPPTQSTPHSDRALSNSPEPRRDTDNSSTSSADGNLGNDQVLITITTPTPVGSPVPRKLNSRPEASEDLHSEVRMGRPKRRTITGVDEKDLMINFESQFVDGEEGSEVGKEVTIERQADADERIVSKIPNRISEASTTTATTVIRSSTSSSATSASASSYSRRTFSAGSGSDWSRPTSIQTFGTCAKLDFDEEDVDIRKSKSKKAERSDEDNEDSDDKCRSGSGLDPERMMSSSSLSSPSSPLLAPITHSLNDRTPSPSEIGDSDASKDKRIGVENEMQDFEPPRKPRPKSTYKFMTRPQYPPNSQLEVVETNTVAPISSSHENCGSSSLNNSATTEIVPFLLSASLPNSSQKDTEFGSESESTYDLAKRPYSRVFNSYLSLRHDNHRLDNTVAALEREKRDLIKDLENLRRRAEVLEGRIDVFNEKNKALELQVLSLESQVSALESQLQLASNFENIPSQSSDSDSAVASRSSRSTNTLAARYTNLTIQNVQLWQALKKAQAELGGLRADGNDSEKESEDKYQEYVKSEDYNTVPTGNNDAGAGDVIFRTSRTLSQSQAQPYSPSLLKIYSELTWTNMRALEESMIEDVDKESRWIKSS